MSNIVNSITLDERFLEYIVFFITFPIIGVVIHHFFRSLLGNKINKEIYIILVYTAYFLANCFVYVSDIIAVASMMVFIGGNQMVFTMIKLVFGKMVVMILELIAVKSFTFLGKGKLSFGWIITAIITPILSILILCSISQIQDIMLTEYMPVVFLPIAMALICINYFVYILCDNMIYKQYTKKQNLLLKQQIEYYQNQYQLAEQTQKETLKFRHDIKNSLLGLKTELDAGRVIEGNDMLNTLIEDFTMAKKVAHSGNLMIDSVINYKKRQADQLLIPFYMGFQFPSDVILNTTVISVILGNAIDNAIDACKDMKDKDKYIKIQFNYQNESLFMKIENPFAGSLRTDIRGAYINKEKRF